MSKLLEKLKEIQEKSEKMLPQKREIIKEDIKKISFLTQKLGHFPPKRVKIFLSFLIVISGLSSVLYYFSLFQKIMDKQNPIRVAKLTQIENDKLRELGISFIREKKWEQATNALNELKKRDAFDEGVVYLALVKKRTDKEEALKLLETYIERNPENYLAINNRAILKIEKKEFLEAKVDYDKIPEDFYQKYPLLYLNKGILYEKMENYDLAFQSYEQYVKLRPKGKRDLMKTIKIRMRKIAALASFQRRNEDV